MILPSNGLDIFYIDESHDNQVYVVTAVAIPFLRPVRGQWTIVWRDYFDDAKRWRQQINQHLQIPVEKELHGLKLASGRGNFFRGQHNFDRPRAAGVYRSVLRNLSFLPDASVMSVAARRGGQFLYGNVRLEAAMHALFQRMRSQCLFNRVGAMTFFDQGHPEYRTLYRKAQVYLPTGSLYSTQTRNDPLSMFFEDANEKDSKHCWFTQIADLIAYVAFLKVKDELGQLTPWQTAYNWGTAYSAIPQSVLNLNAQKYVTPRDAIVRLR